MNNSFAILAALFLTVLIFFAGLAFLLVLKPIESKRARMRTRSKRESKSPTSGKSSENEIFLDNKPLSENPALNRFLISIRTFIKQSGMVISVNQLLSYSSIAVAAVLILGILFHLDAILVLLIMISAGSVPFMIVSFQKKRRIARFEELLHPTLERLANAVKAGKTPEAAMELIVKDMPDPVSSEFKIVLTQQVIESMESALNGLAERVPLPDVQIFVAALIIQRETGSNLAEVLMNISNVIRERFELKRHIQGVTAQGRLSRNILLAVPPAMGFLMYLKNPEYIMMLFNDPRGKYMLYAAILAQVMGFFLIQKIIKPKA
jgi:tight adherence protein B